jgi:hypothetical protein
MTIQITWLQNGFVQTKELVRCRTKQGQINMNSPIYQAIESGDFFIDLGYGKHYFTAKQITV